LGERYEGLLPWLFTPEGRSRFWAQEHFRGRPYKGERSKTAKYTVLPAGSELKVRRAVGQAGNLLADERLAAYEEAKNAAQRAGRRWEHWEYNPINIGKRAAEGTKAWFKGLFDEF
jgi:hypothetical protein